MSLARTKKYVVLVGCLTKYFSNLERAKLYAYQIGGKLLKEI